MLIIFCRWKNYYAALFSRKISQHPSNALNNIDTTPARLDEKTAVSAWNIDSFS